MIDQCLFTLSEIDIFFQSQNVIYTFYHDVTLMLWRRGILFQPRPESRATPAKFVGLFNFAAASAPLFLIQSWPRLCSFSDHLRSRSGIWVMIPGGCVRDKLSWLGLASLCGGGTTIKQTCRYFRCSWLRREQRRNIFFSFGAIPSTIHWVQVWVCGNSYVKK